MVEAATGPAYVDTPAEPHAWGGTADEQRSEIAPADVRVVPHSVRQALAFLRGNLQGKVTLADVATACGLSQRAVLKQFECFLGVSPMAHLHRMRLAAARERLQHSGGRISISEVAARCGFSHMGRFATDYRRAFGELPSTTMRRASAVTRHGSNRRRQPSIPAPSVARRRPILVIVPLRTETLLERRLAQELVELIAATLSRTRVADVALDDSVTVAFQQAAWSSKHDAGDRYCLNGRLVQRDERVRITVWLTDSKGRHVWGDSFDGGTDSLFELLRRVAESVLSGVVPGITGAEIDRIRSKDPRTLAIHEMLTQALPIFLALDGENSRKGFEIASRAMELDRDDPLAIAWAAYCQARLFNGAATETLTARREMALRLAARADAHDASDQPLVITARAAVAYLLEFYEESEDLVQRAQAMDPASGWAHERAGHVLAKSKPDAAIAHFMRAIQLYGSVMPRENCLSGMAQAHHHAGRPGEALRWMRRAYVENPRAEVIHRFLIGYEERTGSHEEARRLAKELSRTRPEMKVSRIVECYPHVPVEYLVRAGVPL